MNLSIVAILETSQTKNLLKVAFVMIERRRGRMRSRWPETPETYSLEYVEEFSGPHATQMVVNRSRSSTFNVGQALRTEVRQISG